MDVKVTVKIKIAKGKEITLDSKEAEELYFELAKIYNKPITYISYPVWTSGTNGEQWVYTTNTGNVSISCVATN